MDKSLDQLIKENPKKFSLNRGKNQARRNNPNKGAVGKAVALAKKNNRNQSGKNGANLGGHVTKRKNQNAHNKPNLKRNINQGAITKLVAGNRVVDARNKLLAKNRLKIKDARDKLADITKKSTTDLRQKLQQKRPDAVKKLIGLKSKSNLRNQKLVRNVGGPLTRTILSRTVENELARQHFQSSLPQFNVAPINSRYQTAQPTQQYYHPYLEPASNVSYKHSTAAMDLEPPLPASRRIRPAEKRLGPHEDAKRSDLGYRVYVDNLHHKVTQEDIFELFGDIGQLIKATLQRPGMAEVVYARREDALRAVDVYHNRQLDGLPMHCTMASNYETRPENDAALKSRSAAGSSKPSVAPDISTIHKALFNKSSSTAQIFTVTLPKKT